MVLTAGAGVTLLGPFSALFIPTARDVTMAVAVAAMTDDEG